MDTQFTTNLLAQYDKKTPINTQSTAINGKIGTWSYANNYDMLFAKYSQYKNFDINMWRDALKLGEQDQYLTFLEQNKDNELSSQFYDPQYYDYESMMLELYLPMADDTNVNEMRTTEAFDPNTGKWVEQEIGPMSDRAYIKYQLDMARDLKNTEITKDLEQWRKDQMSWLAKLGHSTLATGAEFGEGVLNALAGFADLIGAISYATFSGENDNWLDAFVDYIGEKGLTAAEKSTIRAWLDEYERTHTFFRDIDGNITGVGKFFASTANSIGMMVPAIVANAISGGMASVGSSVFYSSIFTHNVYENTTNEYTKNSPSLFKIGNAAIKTGAEAIVEYALGEMFGGTIQNKLIGLKGKTPVVGGGKITALTGAGYVAKSALQEGTEEFLQDFSTALVDQFTGLLEEGYGKEGIDGQTLVDSFVLGVVSSLVMSGGHIGLSGAKSMLVNRWAKKNDKYDTELDYGPGDVVIETEAGLQKLHGWNKLYYGGIVSDFKNALDGLRKDKVNTAKNISLAQEAYSALSVISQFYSSFDAKRMERCETLLNRVIKAENYNNKYIKTDVTKQTFATELENTFKSMVGEIGIRAHAQRIHKLIANNAEELQKNGVTEMNAAINADGTQYQRDPAIGDVEERLGKKAEDILQELLKNYEWVFLTDGRVAIEEDKMLFVSEAWLQNYGTSEIYKFLEHTRVLKMIMTDKELKPMINTLARFHKKFTGQDKATVEQAVMDLLFNKSVYQAFLLSNAGANVHTFSKWIFRLHEIFRKFAEDSKYYQQLFNGKQSQVRLNLCKQIYEQIKDTMREPTIKAIINWGLTPQLIGADSILAPQDKDFIDAYKKHRATIGSPITGKRSSAHEHLAEDIIDRTDFTQDQLAVIERGGKANASIDDKVQRIALLDEADRYMTTYDFEISPKYSLIVSLIDRIKEQYINAQQVGDIYLFGNIVETLYDNMSMLLDPSNNKPSYSVFLTEWRQFLDYLEQEVFNWHPSKLEDYTIDELSPVIEHGLQLYRHALNIYGGTRLSDIGLGAITIPYHASAIAMNDGNATDIQFVADKLDEFESIYGISARQMITGDLTGMSLSERKQLTQDMELLNCHDNISLFVIQKLEKMLGDNYIVTPTRKQINASHSLGYDIKSVQLQADTLSESKNIAMYEPLINRIQYIIDGIDSQKKLFMPESLTEMLEQWYKPFDTIRQYDSVTFNGKPFWCGSVSLLDGVIEEVHTYEEAANTDFHHSMYFSEEQLDKMSDGDNAFFWVDNGKIEGDWRDRIPAEIINKIREQIVPRKVTTTVDYQLKNLKSKIQIGLDFLTAFSEYVESNLLTSNIVDFVIAKSIPAEQFISQNILDEDIETRNSIFKRLFSVPALDEYNRRVFKIQIGIALKDETFKDYKDLLSYLYNMSDWDMDNWITRFIDNYKYNGQNNLVDSDTGELYNDTALGIVFEQIISKLRTNHKMLPLSTFIDISAFPTIDLDKVNVFFADAGEGAAGYALGNKIYVDPYKASDYFATLVHEINHILQAKYNLPNGFNPETARAMPDFLAYVANHYPLYVKFVLERHGYDGKEWDFVDENSGKITEKDVKRMPSHFKDILSHCAYMLVQGEIWARAYMHNDRQVPGFAEIWEGLGQTYLLSPDGKTKFKVPSKLKSSAPQSTPKATPALAEAALLTSVRNILQAKRLTETEGYTDSGVSRATYHNRLSRMPAIKIMEKIVNPNLSILTKLRLTIDETIRNPEDYLSPEILKLLNGDLSEGNVFFTLKDYIENTFEGISIDRTEYTHMYILVDDNAFDDLLNSKTRNKVNSKDHTLFEAYNGDEGVYLSEFYSNKVYSDLHVSPTVRVIISPNVKSETVFDKQNKSGIIYVRATENTTDGAILDTLNHEFRHLMQYYNGFETGFTTRFKVSKEMIADVKAHVPGLFKDEYCVKWAKAQAQYYKSNWEDELVRTFVYYLTGGELNAYAFNASILNSKTIYVTDEAGSPTIFMPWYDAKTGEGRYKTEYLAMRAEDTTENKDAKKEQGIHLPKVERKPKDVRPRTFTKKKAKGTNLERFIKPGQRNQLEPALQDFVIATTGHEKELEPALWNIIYRGTITRQALYKWFRNAKNINNFTFNLINKYIFKNDFITSMSQLDDLLIYQPSYYWAAARVLRKHGLSLEKLVAENDIISFKAFMDSFEGTEWNKEIVEESKKFTLYQTNVDENNNPVYETLDVDEASTKWMRVFMMEFFNGTLAGAFYAGFQFKKTILERELDRRESIKSGDASVGDPNSDDKDATFFDLTSQDDLPDGESAGVGNDIIAIYERDFDQAQSFIEDITHAYYLYEVNRIVNKFNGSDDARELLQKWLSDPRELTNTKDKKTRPKLYALALSSYEKMTESLSTFRDELETLIPAEIVARGSDLKIAQGLGIDIPKKIFNLNKEYAKTLSLPSEIELDNQTDVKLRKDRIAVVGRIKGKANTLSKYIRTGKVTFEALPQEVADMFELVTVVDESTKCKISEYKLKPSVYSVGRGRAELEGETSTARTLYVPKHDISGGNEAYRHDTTELMRIDELLRVTNKEIRRAFAEKAKAEETAQKTIKKLSAKNKQLSERLEKATSALADKNIHETDFEVAHRGKQKKTSDTPNNFQIISPIEMPDVLKDIFNVSFTELADTLVQFASRDKNGQLYDKETTNPKTFDSVVKHEVANWHAFYEAVRPQLLALTRTDVLNIIEFIELGMSTINGPANKLAAFQIFLLGYFLDAARENKFNWNFSTAEIQHLEKLYEAKASQAGSMLAAVRDMKSLVDPLKRVRSRMFEGWISVSDDDTDAITAEVDALQSEKDAKLRIEKAEALAKKLKEMQKTEFEMREKLTLKFWHKKFWTKDNFKRLGQQIRTWRYFAMLSSPVTWIRNQVTNVINLILNSAADVVGNIVFVFLGKKGYRKEQWKLTGVQISPEAKKFIDEHVKKNPLFKNVYNVFGGKYDERQRKEINNERELFVSLITSAIENKYAANYRFDNSVMNMLGRFVDAALSDGPFIRLATGRYFGKMLTIAAKKGEINLSEGFGDTAMNLFTEAIILASQEYMHKRSFLADSIDKFRSEHPAFYEFVTWFQPFLNSSFNWFTEILKYTPVGLIGAINRTIKLEAQIDKLDKRRAKRELVPDSRFAQFLVRRDIGKGTIGLLFGIFGAMLAIAGIVKITEEDDDKFYIVSGDVKVDISSVFGASSVLIGASVAQLWVEQTNGTVWEAERVLDASVGYMLDGFFVNDLLERHRWDSGIYEGLLVETESVLKSFTPQFWQLIIRAFNNEEIKYSSGMKGMWERWLNSFVPTQPAGDRKINPYTGEIETKYSLPIIGEFAKAGTFLGPKIYFYDISETERMCRELGVNKNELTGELTVNKTKYLLDKEKLNLYYGQLNKNSLAKIKSQNHTVEMPNGTFKTLSWDKMSDEQRARVINKTMTHNAEIAKIYVWTEDGHKFYASDSVWQTLRKLGITQNVYKGDKGFVE